MRVEIFDGAALYMGDCREILPTISNVDAVVTDPPYGIGFKYNTYDDDPEKWFSLINDVVPICRRMARFVIMPCCRIIALPWWYKNHEPDWIIAWHKGSPGHQSLVGFNDWEPHLCWGRPKTPMHDHFSTQCGFDDNGHPCPKPIEYALWLTFRAADYGETILDPFMGSGTTGVAAIRQGRKFVGIEIDEKYFNVACRRIDEATKQSDMFMPRTVAKQSKML